MKLIDASHKLLSLKSKVITTRDAAACLKISIDHASKILNRLSQIKIITKLTKGKWAIGLLDPLELPEYLTDPYPCYISLQTALYHYGLISQIPATVYAVSIGKTKQYKTLLGTVSIHHVNEDLFFDFNYIPKTQIKIATPEKALFDVLYLSPARSLIFKTLPEIEIQKNFNTKKIIQWSKMIKSKQRSKMIINNLKRLQNFGYMRETLVSMDDIVAPLGISWDTSQDEKDST